MELFIIISLVVLVAWILFRPISKKELKKYNPEMLDKSRLIAITKSDLLDDELMDEIRLEIGKK